MVRGISWGGTSLPVTDYSLSSTRDPLIEQSMSGLGGETLYGGVYGAAQGSFSGAYRPTVFNTIINNMLTDEPTSATVIAWDDNSNALQAATAYISSVEITMTTGQLGKCTFNFVGQAIAPGTAGSTASFSADVPVFYKSTSTWGDCSEFSVRIERPYAADDYVLGNDRFYSQSIYQSGDTKVTGTIKLTQGAAIATGDPGSITLTLGYDGGGSTEISVTGAVLSNIEMSASGRGLINKTKSWACPSDGITFG